MVFGHQVSFPLLAESETEVEAKEQRRRSKHNLIKNII